MTATGRIHEPVPPRTFSGRHMVGRPLPTGRARSTRPPAANGLPEDCPILVRLIQQTGAAEHPVEARCFACRNRLRAVDYILEVLLRDDHHTIGVRHDPVSASYLCRANSQRHADL